MPKPSSLSRFFSCIRVPEEPMKQDKINPYLGLCGPETARVSLNGVMMQHLVAYQSPCAISSREDDLEKETAQDNTLAQISIADSLSEIRLPEMDTSPSVSIIMVVNDDEYDGYEQAGLVF